MNTAVRVSQAHKVVVVPAAEAVKNLFSDAKSVTLDNAPWLAIKHNPASTFLLRSLGFTVPSPIMHYDFPGIKTPFQVQRDTVSHLIMNTRAYCLNDMGTGKTCSALWAWDYLYSQGLTGKLIVFAPLSTLGVVWAAEILATLPNRKCAIVHGSRQKRIDILADRTVDIYIVNHDGHKIIHDTIIRRTDISHVIIDELAVYRNSGASRTKLMVAYCKAMDWVWGMTGSPIPTSPCDVYAQAQIVTPANVPAFFRLFREQLMVRVNQFKWVPRANAVEQAFNILQPSVRFKLDEVVELPNIIERFMDVPMGTKQTEIYNNLYKHCYALAQQGEVITAANAGGIMSKLLQVAAGWVYSSDGRIAALDNNQRITALDDVIESTSNKILVFATFKNAIDGIHKALCKLGYEDDIIIVTGDTPAGARNEIFTAFQKTSKYRILLAHPQCLAHGVTLTAADTICWFNPTTNLETYEQANRRIRRIGQKNKQQIIHFQGPKVERHVYQLLTNKKNVQSSFLEMFESATP